ncbi:hypothetical protein [Shewanella surugensis]|uniref:Uncharacterized protein n=1 Tax=Shewanella surugensis TaxID=212020 RepID=A0ABT0L677_9GAMM|nr:hypothetical protein [Shewanella surugensis]MCL1123183.1 hypothetical protein [Shewanella surugensis]
MSYDASSIRILSDDEVCDKFEWVRAHELATEYKQPLRCVERAIEACRVTGTPLEHYIERYLKNNKSIPKDHTFENAYLDIMKRPLRK